MHRINKRLCGKLITAILFEVCWFALVVSAGTPTSGVTSLLALAVSLLLVWQFTQPLRNGITFLLIATCGGALVDTALIALGILTPLRSWLPAPLAPLWLIALWIQFSTFVYIVLGYLQGRPLAQWCIGFIGGPLAYWGGARLGAMTLHPSFSLTMLSLALCWGTAMLLLFRLSAWLRRGKGGEA